MRQSDRFHFGGFDKLSQRPATCASSGQPVLAPGARGFRRGLRRFAPLPGSTSGAAVRRACRDVPNHLLPHEYREARHGSRDSSAD